MDSAQSPVSIRSKRERLERDDFSSNRHPALSFCLSTISGQTLRVCPEGKPAPTFPDRALVLSHREKQKYGQQRRGAKNEGSELDDHTMGRAILRSRAMRLGLLEASRRPGRMPCSAVCAACLLPDCEVRR